MTIMVSFIFHRLLDLGRPTGTWEDGCISLFLVLFGGLMSGLTLGLMSLDLVELEVLQRSGTPTEKKQALAVLPVVTKPHQLLVTLVLCNAIAMEALPVFLDNMVSTLVAVILSVTFVLAFGEVIPQAICSRNGLAIGANLGWLVRILMLICFPIAYPIGKLLDLVLGHNTAALFRRSQLKAFVSIHAKEVTAFVKFGFPNTKSAPNLKSINEMEELSERKIEKQTKV
ncbi:hypothetical protein L7F22_063782 [Adiantum nelumboides]|nr:hypothetical protein [Adiantum nelumboides]